jgi:alpha-1,3-glucan synthase
VISVRDSCIITAPFTTDFDADGDTEAFGQHPDWQRQLSRFASVQDRLREWVPSIRQKIEHSLCLLIAQLDVDGFRFDKATQMTVDAAAEISASIRKCARRVSLHSFNTEFI